MPTLNKSINEAASTKPTELDNFSSKFNQLESEYYGNDESKPNIGLKLSYSNIFEFSYVLTSDEEGMTRNLWKC